MYFVEEVHSLVGVGGGAKEDVFQSFGRRAAFGWILAEKGADEFEVLSFDGALDTASSVGREPPSGAARLGDGRTSQTSLHEFQDPGDVSDGGA